jgi:hypothetical protein
MKFKSKIDWWFYLVVSIFAGISVSLIFWGYIENIMFLKILSIILVGVFLLVLLPMWVATYYVLETDTLYIRCGLLETVRMNYSAIVSIEETRNPAQSEGLALSFDRLGIEYKSKSDYRNDYVLISPEFNQEFLKELLKRNPLIVFKTKR